MDALAALAPVYHGLLTRYFADLGLGASTVLLGSKIAWLKVLQHAQLCANPVTL